MDDKTILWYSAMAYDKDFDTIRKLYFPELTVSQLQAKYSSQIESKRGFITEISNITRGEFSHVKQEQIIRVYNTYLILKWRHELIDHAITYKIQQAESLPRPPMLYGSDTSVLHSSLFGTYPPDPIELAVSSRQQWVDHVDSLMGKLREYLESNHIPRNRQIEF